MKNEISEKVRNKLMLDKIKSTKGKFFSLVFVKKNGELRKMKCRTGVKKHLKGGKNLNPNIGDSQAVVYDVEKLGYRTINLNTIVEFNYKG